MSSKYINLEAQGVEGREGRKDGKRKKGKEVGEISLCQKKRFTQPTLAGTWTGDYSFSWIRSQTG